MVQLRCCGTISGHINHYRLLPASLASKSVTMAGLDEAGFTIKTLRQGDVFPTTDYLHSYSPLPTSFTFESTCTDQWTLLNPITPTNIYYPIPASCQPNGETDSTYSPGTCISNYHMVALTEYRTTGWTSGGQRAWGAVCCRE